MDFQPLYERYPISQRASLVMGHVVLKVVSYVVLGALALWISPYLWRGLTGEFSGGAVEILGMILFLMVLLVPLAILASVLLYVVSDRAVTSDRLRRFASANGWSHQQFVRGSIDPGNPFWDQQYSVGHLDVVRGHMEGHEFWLSAITHQLPAGQFRETGLYHTVVCFVGGVGSGDVDSLQRLYENTEVRSQGNGVYMLFPRGISFTPKKLQLFFETLHTAVR